MRERYEGEIERDSERERESKMSESAFCPSAYNVGVTAQRERERESQK